MKKLFDELSYDVSKHTTKKYSTSFSLSILTLNSAIRPAIYSIYAYVRLADEIVDSFHDYDKKKLLNELKIETINSLKDRISLNLIIQSFQKTIHKYNIETSLIYQFLHSMEMDLQKVDYNSDMYHEYIYGSAEVVGLMCLQVFTNGNKKHYNELKPYAMKLGSAFQKVNFLRDLKDDYQILGRTYFPNIDMRFFDDNVKKEIEKDIEDDFNEALLGIKKLPKYCIFGVYLSYKYYLYLFKKIKNTNVDKILKNRIRINNLKKALVMFKSYLEYKTLFL